MYTAGTHTMSSLLQTSCRSRIPCSLIASRSRRLHDARSNASSKFLKISEEVREALNSGKPVVSLETTIYTHGFPYPENIELSNHLESIVRQHGAVPASIGVLNGTARIGMSQAEMSELLDKASKGWKTVKLSRRDIGWICGQGLLGHDVNGGTTIAGTMVLSHLAGIKVFATGGLGGVHKGGEVSMDVSADLTELGRTPVALVSSGCKSFLDIPRTLEYLETQGVCVGTFADGRDGQVDFPAFWTRDSGNPSPRTIRDEKEAAAIIHAQLSLPITSGLLFANPIVEEYSLSKEHMDEVISQAVQDATDAGKSGPENTPFVLTRIRELTKGGSVAANRELVAGNVARGSKVAVELAKLDSKANSSTFWPREDTDSAQNNAGGPTAPVDVLVAGCIALDLSGDYSGARDDIALHTSNPGRFTESAGGVGRNIAIAASYAGASLQLCSVVGDDSAGKYLVENTRHLGLSTESLQVIPGAQTGRYVAFNNANKDLFTAMADMSIIESTGSRFNEYWAPRVQRLQPKWIALDGNWDASSLQQWLSAARSSGSRIAFEPVSEEKSMRLFQRSEVLQDGSDSPYLVDLATPNAQELKAMKNALLLSQNSQTTSAEWSGSFDASDITEKLKTLESSAYRISMLDLLSDALSVVQRIESLLITLGKQGILLVTHTSEDVASQYQNGDLFSGFVLSGGSKHVLVQHFPVPSTVNEPDIVSVNGVGDTFFGVVLAGLAAGHQLDGRLINIAQRAAALTLQSHESVNPKVATVAAIIDSSSAK